METSFDIEQCKKDNGKAIFLHAKVTLLDFTPDKFNLLPVKYVNGQYDTIDIKNLSNIPKKKIVTIYVYEGDEGELWASSYHLPNENRSAKIVDTIEKEYL
jgi:hypothetical protein